MFWASSCVVSNSVVRNVRLYSWVRVVFRVLWMFVASCWVSALEFAMMQIFRLHFVRWFTCLVWVCGSVAILGTYLVCSLRARYGLCFQSGDEYCCTLVDFFVFVGAVDALF
jgi:hypothetical protein